MEESFLQEIWDTAEKVKALRHAGCLCFAVIADSHVKTSDPLDLRRQLRSWESLEAVCRETEPDAIFHLGDIPWANGRRETQEYWDKAKLEEWFSLTRERLSSGCPNVFFVPGNHDGVGYQCPDRKHFHRQLIAFRKERITGFVEDESFYYVDFPEKKVRAVCMLSSFRDGEKNRYGIFPDQVEWLKTDALLVPEDWSILLFTHIYPVKGYDSSNQENTEDFARFLHAFQKGEKLETGRFPADFTGHRGGKIAAMFTGHGHVDLIVPPGALPFYMAETGSSFVHEPTSSEGWHLPQGCSVASRAYGDVTEDLWDMVVYNPAEKNLDFIRFGAGEDRHIDL